MTCQRCGNLLSRVPMFDLPRKVKEFSCLCCGERFWKIQGSTDLTAQPQAGESSNFQPSGDASLERVFALSPYRN